MNRPLNTRSGQNIEFPDFSGHLGRVQLNYPLPKVPRNQGESQHSTKKRSEVDFGAYFAK